MIGLVFSHTKRKTDPDDSWWVNVSRDHWAAEVTKQWLERLKFQGSCPEPTARKMKIRKHRDRDAISGEMIED